jgi:hypothetical protein
MWKTLDRGKHVQGFGGKARRKRPLERIRRRWEDGINMDLREIDWGGVVDLPGLEQGRLAGCCECGDETSSSGTTDLVN